MIKDIRKLAKIYGRRHCRPRFTQAISLQRNGKTYTKGQKMWCPNEQVKAPQTTYERAFHDKGAASPASIRLLGRTSKVLGKHIHHPLCGYGGDRWITGAPVDGYDPKTQTVYQYQGSYWHGCVHCFLNDRQKIINHGKTRDEAFFATAERTRPLREAGYRVIKKWECQDKKRETPTKTGNKTYPTQFSTISNRTTTKRSRTRRRATLSTKTHRCQFR